jgi:hypothetical protein
VLGVRAAILRACSLAAALSAMAGKRRRGSILILTGRAVATHQLIGRISTTNAATTGCIRPITTQIRSGELDGPIGGADDLASLKPQTNLMNVPPCPSLDTLKSAEL